MIFDNNAPITMAQQAADMSNTIQLIYKRKDGSYLYCSQGNVNSMRQMLGTNEQLHYIGRVRPSHWPKEEKSNDTV